ncbi:serine hydrolase domain-containing protein [Nocardia cyriacigeorgica]|uniref:serine hydrolase domain-containing protein n=1 Tax=Nocardia cyriacigeorgica TaxID=135487 RepID=UPI0013D1EC46|nr:serine hydrolase domain-containing protein [Nocardia cyriacigeorgica]NEW27091.1 beta-lactamase family protein [Nocardia cyriacigeorgica]
MREEFERNFAERGEVGASVCVYVDGKPVVDLWGGTKNASTGEAWAEDTIGVVFSCTKGFVSMCANMLIDRGLLDPEKPIAHYWPEFAQQGKENIPVKYALNHTSGVFHVDDIIPLDGFNDWDLMIGLLERTRPAWEPGTAAGYHGMMFGWLIGELVRRIDGRSIGTFFREEIAEPLGGLEAWIGLPPELEGRAAKVITFDPADMPPEFFAEQLANPDALSVRLATNGGGWVPDRCDLPQAHAAENPVGALTNARGLAGAYVPFSLDGSFNGVRFVSPPTIDAMRYHRTAVGKDLVLGISTAFSRGFAKSWWNPAVPDGSQIFGEDAFGYTGLGGQTGFADPSHRLAFAYTMNKHGMGTALNARGQALVDATYRSLGATNHGYGFWSRGR